MSDSRVSVPSAAPAVEALRQSLESIGVTGRVEARDRLAVLLTSDATALRDAAVRRRALLLAREHGFTNLALELGADTTAARASLPRD